MDARVDVVRQHGQHSADRPVRILIGTDGSRQATSGLDVVRHLDLARIDRILVVTAIELPIGWMPFAGAALSVETLPELQRATDVAERITAEAAAMLSACPVVIPQAIVGHPIEVLEDVAREHQVDVVVVGPHGYNRLESLVMGSVSNHLLHAMRNSVLIARPILHGFRAAVLAVDGSPASEAATRLLARLPLPHDAVVTCLSVVPSHSGPYGSAWPEDMIPRIEEHERTAAERILRETAEALPFASVSEIRSGPVARAIVESAESAAADLIVVGARGLGGFERLLLGSVSHAVAKAAKCSVLVARGAETTAGHDPRAGST